MILLAGLITGILFGFFLQKGQIVKYDKQIGALIFEDFTIFKFMFSAIITATILLWLFKDLGWVSFHAKPMRIVADIVGGTIFGLGWGLIGY